MGSLTERKQIRLKKFDYSQNGAYFVTLCVKDMKPMLWSGEKLIFPPALVGANCVRPPTPPHPSVGANCVRPPTPPHPSVGTNCVRPPLSAIGKIVDNEIAVLSEIYDNIHIDKYVVMPNHIHMIIIIETQSGRTQFAPTVSRIIKQCKGSVTKQLGVSIWQKSFYDHVIRSEDDYLKIWKYIDENPAKWAEDRYFCE